MTERGDYPATLQAVIDWAEGSGSSWEYNGEGDHLEFAFTWESISYTGTAIDRDNGNSLTLSIVLEMPEGIDELTLRRRISDVDIGLEYGALILNHELWLVVWRDTMSSDNEGDFDAAGVDSVLECGVTSFDALRLALADVLGVSPEDARLSQMPVSGFA